MTAPTEPDFNLSVLYESIKVSLRKGYFSSKWASRKLSDTLVCHYLSSARGIKYFIMSNLLCLQHVTINRIKTAHK